MAADGVNAGMDGTAVRRYGRVGRADHRTGRRREHKARGLPRPASDAEARAPAGAAPAAGADPTGALLAALHARGVRSIHRVAFKENRTRLLSVSRDGATLYAHTCYRGAPAEVHAAIATFLTAARGSAEQRAAVARIRDWGAAHRPPATDRTGAPRPPRPGPCCATPAQRARLIALYGALNEERFAGRLPARVPLRLSRRMSRRLGHVRYHRDSAGARTVIELALNADLVLDGNETVLRDTLLHEMAHIEAWLEHGEGGHGAVWRRIALRVGCEPRACMQRALPVTST
ncbi:MAG TPA: SprT-like domain-containing protein [Longimicrobiales bacterium]